MFEIKNIFFELSSADSDNSNNYFLEFFVWKLQKIFEFSSAAMQFKNVFFGICRLKISKFLNYRLPTVLIQKIIFFKFVV